MPSITDDNVPQGERSSHSQESRQQQPAHDYSEGISISSLSQMLASSWASLNPGHVMLGGSLPFLYRAYRLYHSPIDDLVEHIAKAKSQGQLQNMADLKDADIAVRRAVGFGVAGRALRLGTLISFGSFGVFGAAVFFVGGWRTTQEAIMATREWGNDKRKGLDQMLGVTERVDDDHPELLERQKLTPEEERAYLVQKYWAAPQKETTTIDATLSQQTQQEGVLETNKDSSKS